MADGGAADLDAATEWLTARGFFSGLADEFQGLAGNADIDLAYNDETRIVRIDPSLSSLAELGRRAESRAREWDAPPPYAELEALAHATAAIFKKLAALHDYQVRYLSRLTPDAFDNGSWRVPATEFQSGYQRQIDAITEPGPAWFAANEELIRAIEAIGRRG